MFSVDSGVARFSILALAILSWSPQVFALTCWPRDQLAKRADVIFAATAERVTLEPPGVSPPEVAIHRFGDVPEAALEDLQEGETFEMKLCDPQCRTWSGTIDDLPAKIIDPWYEIELSVGRVWKGSIEATEIIYSNAALEVGIEYIFLLGERTNGNFTFGGPCYQHSVFPADNVDISDLLGAPSYSFD